MLCCVVLCCFCSYSDCDPEIDPEEVSTGTAASLALIAAAVFLLSAVYDASFFSSSVTKPTAGTVVPHPLLRTSVSECECESFHFIICVRGEQSNE